MAHLMTPLVSLGLHTTDRSEMGQIPGVPTTGVWVLAGWGDPYPDPDPDVPYPLPTGFSLPGDNP